jgi:uncharacterized coiled-coil DUF342 family protein
LYKLLQANAAEDALELAKADAVTADRLADELHRRDKHAAAATLASRAIQSRQEIVSLVPKAAAWHAESAALQLESEELRKTAGSVAEEVAFSQAMLAQLQSVRNAVSAGAQSRAQIVTMQRRAVECRQTAAELQQQASAARAKADRIRNEVCVHLYRCRLQPY